MLGAIKLTSKRQATFPAAMCRELGVKPGDELILERRTIDGQMAWILQTPRATAWPWYGRLRRYAKGKAHDLESIRRSVGARRHMP